MATLFIQQKYGDKVKVHYWGMACIKFIKQELKGFDLYGLPMEVCPLGTVKFQKQGERRGAPVCRYISEVNECIVKDIFVHAYSCTDLHLPGRRRFSSIVQELSLLNHPKPNSFTRS